MPAHSESEINLITKPFIFQGSILLNVKEIIQIQFQFDTKILTKAVGMEIVFEISELQGTIGHSIINTSHWQAQEQCTNEEMMKGE